jgi:putative ABC transport system permease protein
MSWLSAARTRLHLIFARKATESRADIEIGFHIDMETQRLMREKQLSPDEARRQAIVSFGGVSQHKETLREGHGLAWLGGFSLDMKLGARMLRKYPGLTLIGGLAMAFALWTGAVIFQILSLLVYPTLPLPDGDRIVQLWNFDIEAGQTDGRAMHDFLRWRRGLSSITELGAYRDLTRNLITTDGDSRHVAGAEVTASAFRIAPTPPLMGRVIVPSDEEAGAPPVVVLGYDLWRARFARDPGVLGRSVKLGDATATVVGVMPEGFGFPFAHELWTQLRPDVSAPPRGGQGITVFGKLAPGVSFDRAQAELTTLGKRAAAEFPATHARLEPRVQSYAKMGMGQSSNDLAIAGSIYFFVMLLLVLVCSNVALLIFARAATREGELVVRSALGADRKRIVMQLFAEALVLGGVAATVGLIVADVALRTWARPFLETNMGTLPFWYDLSLSPMTLAWSLGLTVLSAAIAGMLPALKITRGLGARLKQGTAGGGGVRFGGVWTAVIIAQVAVTVAFPSIIAVETRELRRIKSFDIGFAAGDYLGVRVVLDALGVADSAQMAANRAHYGRAVEELRRRVASEPGVGGVTFVERLPRLNHRESYAQVVGGGADTMTAEVSFTLIDPSYFEVLQSPILAGRAFVRADAGFQPRAVIVDQLFVDQLLHGRNAVGRQMRLVEPPRRDGKPSHMEPWVEIVGVVKELGMTDMHEQYRMGGVYFPADLSTTGTMFMVVHAPGNPMALVPRIRELTAAVDPMLRLTDMYRLDQVEDSLLWVLNMWIRLSVVLAAIAVLLSLAGIYAVLSFTVSRRTREIGVRVALGASRKRLIVAIFKRPLINVTLGVLGGAAIIALLSILANEGDGGLARVEYSFANVATLVGYAAFMLCVCLLACVVPTRRALRVEPTEALRAE